MQKLLAKFSLWQTKLSDKKITAFVVVIFYCINLLLGFGIPIQSGVNEIIFLLQNYIFAYSIHWNVAKSVFFVRFA